MLARARGGQLSNGPSAGETADIFASSAAVISLEPDRRPARRRRRHHRCRLQHWFTTMR